MMWRVLFDCGVAFLMPGNDAEWARREARLLAWTVTGQWLTVTEVTRA
jgi:hypothetical protein